MKNSSVIQKLLISLLILVATSASSQIQQAWVAKYDNGIPNGNHQALKMALDSSGNIYVLGVSANANTNTGYVVVKYAPNGNPLWTARYDSTNFPAAAPTGFALDSSNAVVVTGSAVTVKFDDRGSQLWVAPYTGTAVTVDLGQNVYATGISGNFTTMKFNSAGSNVWSTTWTYQGLQNVSQAIAVDSSTNVYVAGLETQNIPRTPYQNVGLLKYDLNGNQLWVNNIDQGSPIASPTIVGFLLDDVGASYLEFNCLTSLGDGGGYRTCKVNSDGTTAWYGENPTPSVASLSHGLAFDNQGDVFVTGRYEWNVQTGTSSYGTYELSTNGGYLWTNLFPGDGATASVALALATDEAGNVIVTGDSTNAGSSGDIVTIKYDNNGNQKWLQRYDGPGHGNDAGNAIAVDHSGNVYVAGYETETNGFTSMILIKYSPVSGQKQPNGSFILHAYGSPGESFDLQASTNLQTWQDLGSVIADTNGIVSFDDTNAPFFPNRFYYTVPQ